MCLFIELGKHVYHGERMNSIDFGCYRSKVKVTMTMCIIDKRGCAGMLRFALLYFLGILLATSWSLWCHFDTAAKKKSIQGDIVIEVGSSWGYIG